MRTRMHELSIAEAVLQAVRRHALCYPDSRPIRIGLKIGELAALDGDSLRFCFEAIVKGTDLDGLQLAIEVCPRRQRCLSCEQEFFVQGYDLRCPQCADDRSECIGGDELDLAYLEVEEHATSGIGAESTK